MMTVVLYRRLVSSGLLLGAIIGLITAPSRRVVAAVIVFGSGVLVSALTFKLMDEAFEKDHVAYVVVGFLAGARCMSPWAICSTAWAALPRREGRHARDVEPAAQHIPESQDVAAVSGTALLVGVLLDGIPENVAIGISLFAEGRGIGVVLLAAVFLGNLPESISSSVDMRYEGRSRAFILGVWTAAVLICTVASVAGYGSLGGLSASMISAMLALAAGGPLAMHADTMLPEAFEHGGPLVALATAVGFMCAFLLSHVLGRAGAARAAAGWRPVRVRGGVGRVWA